MAWWFSAELSLTSVRAVTAWSFALPSLLVPMPVIARSVLDIIVLEEHEWFFLAGCALRDVGCARMIAYTHSAVWVGRQLP